MTEAGCLRNRDGIGSPPRSCLTRWWFWAVILGGAAARMAFVGSGVIELSPDEAVYWQYSRRLDWCYYTKGPLVAYLIWAGTHLLGATELGVRIGSIALSAASMGFLCRLYERLAPGERLGTGGLLLAQHCVPLSVAGSVLMTIDNPLCCCWVVALWALHGAVRDGRRGRWAWLGAAVGVGLMAKPAMFFIVPVVFLYLGLSRENRRWLRTPYPYLALAGGCLTLLPQVWWNARHDWVMLAHQVGRAGGLRLDRMLVYPLRFLAGQAAVVSPVLFGLVAVAAVDHVRRWREDASLLVVSGAAPAAVFFAGMSLMRQVNENWPAVMYPSLMAGAAMYWARRWGSRRARLWVAGGLALGGAIVALLLWPAALMRGSAVLVRAAGAVGWKVDLAANRLPQARLLGWRQMALFAAEHAKGMRRPPFFLSHRPDQASLLAFYLPGRPWTYVLPHRRVSNQYDIWGGWDELVGRDAVFVRRLRSDREADETASDAPEELRSLFERCEGGEIGEATEAGRVIARHQVWRCEGFRGRSPAAGFR